MIWTMSHDQVNTVSKFSVCGSEVYPESKFSVPIDISIPASILKLSANTRREPTGRKGETKQSEEKSTARTHSYMKVAFGSNLEELSSAYFGLSSFSVYMRSRTRKK